MKTNNPYFYLANSQLFPFIDLLKTVNTDNVLLKTAQEALILIDTGDRAKALALYSSTIEKFPQYPFFYACRSLLNSNLGDEEGAFYDYQIAKKLDFNYHNFLEWRENKGAMLIAQELDELNKEIRHNTPSAQHYINRAMLWVQHFDYERAIEDYDQALTIVDNPDIRISRAAVFMRMLRYDIALKDLDLALDENPNLPNAYLYRAKLQLCIREDESALADFEKAIQLSPDNTEIYEERANYYERIENWPAAIADYTSVIAQNPTDFYCYVLRADVFERVGSWQQAIADYDEAIRLNPHYSDLYQYRGELKQKLGDHPGAAADFDKFEELEQE